MVNINTREINLCVGVDTKNVRKTEGNRIADKEMIGAPYWSPNYIVRKYWRRMTSGNEKCLSAARLPAL